MELLRLAGLCALCMLPVTLLRKTAPEQALLLTAAILSVTLARCLRLGTPLAGMLDEAAAEARAQHKAQLQERVAKAPVKMMVPTAAFMLPALLLLVLGPVLLQLAE